MLASTACTRRSLLRDVLLIDNNAIQLRVRETVLRHAAFLSRVPARARALNFVWLLPAPVKVILTDHLTPGTGGLVFVRQVRNLGPDIPVLVISGMFEVEDEYAGFDITFLRKLWARNPRSARCRLHLEQRVS